MYFLIVLFNWTIKINVLKCLGSKIKTTNAFGILCQEVIFLRQGKANIILFLTLQITVIELPRKFKESILVSVCSLTSFYL